VNYQQGQLEGPPAPPPEPSNVEAEAALLGALMIDNRLVADVAPIVGDKHFYEPLHAHIYRVINKFVAASKVANPVTLKPIFEHDPAMIEIGGPAYLAQLTGSGASVIGARSFAEQIRDLAHMRAVKGSVARGLDRMEESGAIDDFFVEVEKAVAEASNVTRAVPIFSAADMVKMTIDRTQASLEKGVPGAACKLIPDVDTLLGKLEPGQMTILAGRPGMGKSTTALSASLGYALNGHPTIYALAESSAEMFALKFTADLLHAAGKPIPFKSLRQSILTRDEFRWLVKANEVAGTLPHKFAYTGRADIRTLESIVAREANRQIAAGRRLEVAFVDYLQLYTAEGRHKVGDDRGRINAVSEGLLAIAQKYGLHVVALSQLSRAVEQRPDKRPHLSDLRDSGRLEEDADNVVMVYREEYYLEQAKPTDPKALEQWEEDMGFARGKVELIAAKTRFGANATRRCNFFGDHSAVRGSNYHADIYSEDDLFRQDDGEGSIAL
jgi:replicative DNA helicase